MGHENIFRKKSFDSAPPPVLNNDRSLRRANVGQRMSHNQPNIGETFLFDHVRQVIKMSRKGLPVGRTKGPKTSGKGTKNLLCVLCIYHSAIIIWGYAFFKPLFQVRSHIIAQNLIVLLHLLTTCLLFCTSRDTTEPANLHSSALSAASHSHSRALCVTIPFSNTQQTRWIISAR